MADLRGDEDRAIEQLKEAGQDPYIYRWQKQPDGTIEYKQLGTAFRTADVSSPTYFDKKRRRTLPLVEAKALAKFAPWLRYFCQRRTHLWCGVVTLDQPCPVADVANRRLQTMTATRRFFERCRFNVELIFTIIHEEVADYRDCNGQVLVNVHAHCLFICKDDKSYTQSELEAAFVKRFPIGSRIERVKHRGKLISYILRTPDLRPLLDSGEYVNWTRVVQRRRRMCCYGLFRRKLAQWRKQRKTIGRRIMFSQPGKREETRFYLMDKPPRKVRCNIRPSSTVVLPLDTIVGTTIINGETGPLVADIVKNPSPAPLTTLSPLSSDSDRLNHNG
jgi:hypothetical protein